ncbi:MULTISPECIES: DNA-directed RNA polymerase subunit beta [Cryobacterium]|uniref:DNA-directed RNA polymerase subunit beta n=1 Tax=Cryobacterium breve TaxID=1259258 RepID=A0ABY2JAU4_9MICO|nr:MULTISPECIES: DNA-directed RNA polymerase subunit beta [Cryobacterium]TFC96256.1 DNA-directed RNA polymerase subunit beta [Cryobacterium sp. TmT3-12]TFD00739.1 DNA-directed RNA polymerase subunit beta [Cryobacterium breve]
MAENFHKPTQFSGSKFESFQGGDDPAAISRVAHETAHALLARVRSDPDPEIVDRLVAYTDEHGIDAVAELWSRATPRSLPGAMWRLYLVRLLIRQDPAGTSFLYQRGSEVTPAIDPLIAGAAVPTGTAEIIILADQILRGIFTGDFAVALDRAAAFCRVISVGCTSIADDLETTEPARSTELTTRALRFSTTAQEFASCARLWRSESLD